MCSTSKMEKDEQYRTNSYNHLIIKKPSNKSRNEPELFDRQQCFGYCNGVDNAKEQQQTAKQTEWVQSKMGATKTNSTFLEFKGNESHMETKYIALCSLHSGSSLFHFSHLTAMMKQVFYLQSLSHAPQQYPVELESWAKDLGTTMTGLVRWKRTKNTSTKVRQLGVIWIYEEI